MLDVPAHLKPSGPTAPDALLPGDPGRAMRLAQTLIEAPLMSNHSRGLWGYHGRTAAGRDLTIQATGIGAPSAAIVLFELATLGVRRAIRVGSCRALDSRLGLGEMVVVEAAHAEDGVSHGLGESGAVAPDAELTSLLARNTGGPAVIQGRPPPAWPLLTYTTATRSPPAQARSPPWRWRPPHSLRWVDNSVLPPPACWSLSKDMMANA